LHCGWRAAIASALPVATIASAATWLLLHLLRLGLMAQLRLGPILHFRRDTGLADPVGMGL
jgi:hypothetical protein